MRPALCANKDYLTREEVNDLLYEIRIQLIKQQKEYMRLGQETLDVEYISKNVELENVCDLLEAIIQENSCE